MSTNLRNTKSTPELLQSVAEMVMAGNLRPTRLAKMAGVTYKTFCRWGKESREGNPKYLIEFLGEEMQFCVALDLARKFAMSELRGSFEEKCVLGYDEYARKDGQLVWKIDREAAAMSEDVREIMGKRKDALLEIDGKLVPETIHHEPPVAATLRALEVAFKDYRPSSTQEITLQGNPNAPIGIAVSKKVDYSGNAPAIPPAPAIPQLEILDGEVSEVPAPTPTIQVVLAPTVNIASEPEPVPEVTRGTASNPEPVPAKTAPAPAPANKINTALTPMRRDLMAQWQAKLKSNADAGEKIT
jgi:hypothetical protein